MKNNATIPTAIILLALFFLFPVLLHARDTQYVPGEVLVKFKVGTLAKDSGSLHATLKTSKKKNCPN